jgi:hypothetical protein
MPHKPPHNSDDYAATMLAVGPGVLACVLLGFLEFGLKSVPSFGIVFPLTAYGVALLGFLPGLPIFGYCLSQAIPRSAGLPPIFVSIAWLAACPFAVTWHFLVIDLSFRSWQVESPVDWLFVIRYGICISVVTAALWTVHVVRRKSEPRT